MKRFIEMCERWIRVDEDQIEKLIREDRGAVVVLLLIHTLTAEDISQATDDKRVPVVRACCFEQRSKLTRKPLSSEREQFEHNHGRPQIVEAGSKHLFSPIQRAFD